MSVPFSNTHLRVPQGFGTILEGLAREVLRNQPQDIPKYAADYFDDLLKERDESGMDPAEWAAKLEDRYYNNPAFKNTEQPSAEKKSETDLTSSKEKSYGSQPEDASFHSAEESHHSTIQQLNASEVNYTEQREESEEEEEEEEEGGGEGEGEEEEEHILALSKSELVNRHLVADVQSYELSETLDDRDPSITISDQIYRDTNENESSSDIRQSDSESTDMLSCTGVSNVDACAQELGAADNVGGDEPQTDMDILDSEEEETSAVEEPVQVLPYSGLAGVDVCGAELGGTEGAIERATVDGDTLIQSEEVLVQSSLFHISENKQREAENNLETTNPKEGIEVEASVETQEHLDHVEASSDSVAAPKEDAVVELSSENNVATTDEIIFSTQDEDNELEKDKHEKEVGYEPEEGESQHEISEIKPNKTDTNDSNPNDSGDDDDDDDDDDDEKGEGVKNISLSHQPTTEADEEDPDDENDRKNEDHSIISEMNGIFENQTLANVEEEETTDVAGRDNADVRIESYNEMKEEEINDGDAENLWLQTTQSNVPTAAMATESETFEVSARHLPEENTESQRTLVETQPEDTMEEREFTSKEDEELLEKEVTDAEMQEKGDAVMREGESISLIHSADGGVADHQGEERPTGSGEDTTECEGLSDDKQEECSRPQEEEDIMDIPLDDPEANRAAAKIQAGFRGHMTRKKLKPEDKAEGEEVSSTGDVLNGSQGDAETGGSGAVERDDTSVPEQ